MQNKNKKDIYNWLPGDDKLRGALKSYLLANPMNISKLASNMGMNQASLARFIEGKQSLVLRTRILVYNYLNSEKESEPVS